MDKEFKNDVDVWIPISKTEIATKSGKIFPSMFRLNLDFAVFSGEKGLSLRLTGFKASKKPKTAQPNKDDDLPF